MITYNNREIILKEKDIRKLAEKFSSITNRNLNVPEDDFFDQVYKHCNEIFSGQVYWSYSYKVGCCLAYSIKAKHIGTQHTLISDIQAGKRIYIQNYQ